MLNRCKLRTVTPQPADFFSCFDFAISRDNNHYSGIRSKPLFKRVSWIHKPSLKYLSLARLLNVQMKNLSNNRLGYQFSMLRNGEKYALPACRMVIRIRASWHRMRERHANFTLRQQRKLFLVNEYSVFLIHYKSQERNYLSGVEVQTHDCGYKQLVYSEVTIVACPF